MMPREGNCVASTWMIATATTMATMTHTMARVLNMAHALQKPTSMQRLIVAGFVNVAVSNDPFEGDTSNG